MIADCLKNPNRPSNFTLQSSCFPPATLDGGMTQPKTNHTNALLRRLSLSTLILVAAGCGNAAVPRDPPVAIPTAELFQERYSPETITQGLPWKFSVSTEQTETDNTTRTLFVSEEPVEDSGGKTVSLSAFLETQTFDRPEQAAGVFAKQADNAHPDTGLTYAWDLLVLDGAHLHHLHAPCLFSEESFNTMSANLRKMISPASRQTLRCRCGGGCAVTNGG